MKRLLPLIPVLLLVSCKTTTPTDGTDPYASAYPGYDPNSNAVPPPPAPSDYAYDGANTTPVSTDPYAVNPYTNPQTPAPVYPPADPQPTYTPPPATSGRSYTVQRGDTLWRIARENNTSVGAIKSANGITSDAIISGQRITLP